jgi:hypothetical protein
MTESEVRGPLRGARRVVDSTRDFVWQMLRLTPKTNTILKKDLEVFDALECLSADLKSELREGLIQHQTRYNWYFACRQVYGIIAPVLALVLVVLLAWLFGVIRKPMSFVSENFILFYALLYAMFVPSFLLSRFIRSKWFADSYLVDRLLYLLGFIELNEARWLNLQFRRDAMKWMETIARIVERDIRRAMRTRDPMTKQWVQQRTWQTAAGIRELKTWFVIPGSLTRLDLIGNKLVPTFVAAVTGDWDKMVRVMHRRPESSSRLARLVAKGLTTGITLLAICLLIASFYIQTEHGKRFLDDLGVSSEGAGGLATIIGSVSAALLLYLAQSGKSKAVTESDARKAAEVVIRPNGDASASQSDQAREP